MTTGYLYVPNEYDNTISVIDISNDSVVATIPVGGNYADTVAVSPDGALVYVASESGIVSVIDTSTNSVVSTIGVGSQPYVVAFSPNGATAFVTNASSNTVSVINTAENVVVATINVGSAPYGVAFPPDGSRAYVTNEGAGTVSVIDTATNSVVSTINVGSLPTILAISPDGSQIYVDNYRSGTVSVIDPTTNTVKATINVGGDPYGVVFSPDGSRAYVANDVGAVSVIDTGSKSVIDTISVGEAVGIAISHDGSHLYVSHYKGSDTVTVIDTTTNTIVDTINVGHVPEYLAVLGPPPAPQLALAVDSGISNSDDVTNVGTVVVKGLLNGDTWQYSTDNGATWINGTGSSFTLTGDGTKTVLVHQTDLAHLTSNDSNLTFVLDAHAPVVTETLKNDTGSSPTDHLTKDPTLTGSGDPNATVQFTADGVAIAATATADSTGNWTFVPTGLLDGVHTIIASETDIAGNTGTASLTFTLDTMPPLPTITNEILSNGKVSLIGTTAEANDAISVYDGSNLLGTETTDANGNWDFVTAQVSNAVHVYTVTATDPAGNLGHGNEAILGSTTADTLVGGPGNDIIIGRGGNDTFIGGGGADMLFSGSGHDTFVFNAITDSTPASHDTIVNFNHSTDQIEFAHIAGITGSNGIPAFEGKLSGSGNLSLNAHSVAYVEVGGNTEVLVNTTASAESVTLSDTHAANMEIVLSGTHLGLTSHDFHIL